MKKSLRVVVLVILTAGFTLPSAFAGPGGGNPSPIGRGSYTLSSAVTVILSLLGM